MYFINLWYSTRYNLQCIIGLLELMIFAQKLVFLSFIIHLFIGENIYNNARKYIK